MTTEILVFIVAATFAALGYFAASSRKAGAYAKLQAQYDHDRAELERTKSSIDEYKQNLDKSLAQLTELSINSTRLEERLESIAAEKTRADEALQISREELATQQRKFEVQGDELRALSNSLSQSSQKVEDLLEGLQRLESQLSDVKADLQAERDLKVQEQQKTLELSNELAQLKSAAAANEEHHKQQIVQLNDAKASLTKEFEVLANKIFEEKGKTFTHTSQSSIDSMLKPFREQIEGFQKRVNDVHDASVKGNADLAGEIKKVLDIGLKMSQDASNLTSALKGDSQQRGAWGEAQLRRTLEMSGLVEEAHYEVQSSFKDAEGKHKQTDYLIKLPDGKHIIIDSKVSLNAYDRAVGADTPEAHQLAMSEHVKAVRKHIDDLASKDYTNLIGMHSPNFVLMFMPIEPAYIEALKNNKDLFEYGYKKGIVLVSHTTLIPILRTVSNLWMIERSNAEAREISEKAGDIYNQVCLVAERLSKLGGTLSTVSNHYNSTVKALAGQQGLYGKVDRFNQLSAKVTKDLPQLEVSHMDFETERLALIVEPVDVADAIES